MMTIKSAEEIVNGIQPTQANRVDYSIGKAAGFLEAVKRFEPILKALQSPYGYDEDACYQVCVNCGALKKALKIWEEIKGK